MHFGRTLKTEKCKNLVSVYKTFKNLLLQNYSTKFLDITYKLSLGMCNQSLFKWWCHLHYLQINSERQFEQRKFDANLRKSSSPKLLIKNS